MMGKRSLRDRIVALTVGQIERHGNVRVVRNSDYAALVADRQKLKQELSSYRQTADSEELVRLAAWMRRLERADQKGQRIRDFADAARRTARLVADHLADLLSLGRADDDTVGRVQAMLASGADLTEIARDLARRNGLDPGRIRLRSFPADSPDQLRALLGEVNGVVQIVDVGEGAAKRAQHAYAPLAAAYPTAALVLDPTAGEGTVAPSASAVNAGACALTILGRRIGAASGTLDAALAEAGCPAIDLLRLDTPHDPMDVLAGAARTLERALVCQLGAVVSNPRHGVAPLAAIDAALREKGLVLADIAATDRRPIRAAGGASAGSAGLLMAECVYVRRVDPTEKVEKEALLRLAAIAHALYRKYDLAAGALAAYDAVTGERRSAGYATATVGAAAAG